MASTAPAIPLDATATFAARTLDAGVWSAIDAVTFLINDPASAANLAITEIEYNPHAVEPGELDVDKEEYEFIELRNDRIIFAGTLDLLELVERYGAPL